MADLHHRPRSAPKTAQTLDFIGYRGACPQFFPILIDTNVFVSALWSANPASPTFRTYHAMLTQLFVPLYSDEIIAEYEDVLYRSKFGFDARQADEIIDLVRRFGERITPAEQGDEIFPDPDDKVFYCVALAAQNDDAKLVTGNTKHFPSAPFVVSPAEFAALLG